MANVNYKEIVAVCGLIGSGKSRVAQLIAENRGYTYISADAVFKKDVATNPEYLLKYNKFMELFGFPNSPQFDGAAVSQTLFNEAQKNLRYPILRAFNKMNHRFMEDAIREYLFGMNDIILEMATFPRFHTGGFRADAIIMVMGDGWSTQPSCMQNHINRVLNRDGRNPETTGYILHHQANALAEFTDCDHVYKLHNMNLPSVYEDEGDFMEDFKPDSEILEQFDEIIKSARALRHVGLLSS